MCLQKLRLLRNSLDTSSRANRGNGARICSFLLIASPVHNLLDRRVAPESCGHVKPPWQKRREVQRWSGDGD